MAVLDFPNNPVPGSTYVGPSGQKYTFDGLAWVVGGTTAVWSWNTRIGDVVMTAQDVIDTGVLNNVNADISSKVSKAGDTMTGNLTVAGSWPTVALSRSSAAVPGQIASYVADNLRWLMALGTTEAESGASAGSNFTLSKYDDTGAYTGTALQINRATNKATFGGTVVSDFIPGQGFALGGEVLSYGGAVIPQYGVSYVQNGGWSTAISGFTSIQFVTSSTERMRIDGTSGNVGIGMSAPGFMLDVAGTAHADVYQWGVNQHLLYDVGPGQIGLRPSAAGVASSYFTFRAAADTSPMLDGPSGQLAFSTAGVERMRVNSNGLGVGTTNPLGFSGYGWITINGAADVGANLSFSGGDIEQFRIQSVQNAFTTINNLNATPMLFNTNNIERMRIDGNNGNVGIGCVPGAKLEVNGPPFQIVATDGTVRQVVGYAANAIAYSGTETNHDYSLMANNTERLRIITDGSMVFYGLGVERMRITPYKFVGINIATPQAMLHVEGGARLGADNLITRPSSGSNGGVHIGWNYSAGDAETGFWNLFDNAPKGFSFKQKVGADAHADLYTFGNAQHAWYTQGIERMRLDVYGNVGIGTSTPSSYGTGHSSHLSIFNFDQTLTLGAHYEAGVAQYSFLNASDVNNAGVTAFAFQTGGITRFMLDADGTTARFGGSGALGIHHGTTAQRPATPAAGMFRFNTEVAQFEGYNGAAWGPLGSGGGATGGIDQATADALYVNAIGDTMTGTLAIQCVWPGINLYKPDGTAASGSAQIVSYTGDKLRWQLELGNTSPETGGNSGSDFNIARFDDAGAYLGPVFTINRVTGGAIFQAYDYNGSQLYVRNNVSDADAGVLITSTGMAGGTYIRLQNDGLDRGYLSMGGTGYPYLGGANALSLWNKVGPLVLATNDTEKMRIDNAGNVGIGTSAPLVRLDVAGDVHISGPSPTLWFRDTDHLPFGIHVNSSIAYFMRGNAPGVPTWDVLPNGHYPMMLELTNGTLTTGGGIYASNNINVDGPSANIALTRPNGTSGATEIVSFVAGQARWTIAVANNAVETGANTGSDFVIGRFNDAGVYQDSPFSIRRATGDASFFGTGALGIHNGTTVQRPVAPFAGMLRFNTTTSTFEGYNGTAWGALGGGGGAYLPLTGGTVTGTITASNFMLDTVRGLISSGNASTMIYFDANDYLLYDRLNNQYIFRTANADKFRISNDGSVEAYGPITAPTLRVDSNYGMYLGGANSTAPIMVMDVNDYWIFDRATNTLSWNIAGAAKAILGSDGNISASTGFTVYNQVAGLYSDAGATTLALNTSCTYTYYKGSGAHIWSTNAVNRLFLYLNGEFTATSAATAKPGGGAWTDSSDIRIKDVHGAYESGLAEIVALNPVRYSFKGNDDAPDTEDSPAISPHGSVLGQEFIGLIAQEAELVMPEMISLRRGFIDGAPVNDIRDLNPSALVYALVNAVKELSAKIEALEAAASLPVTTIQTAANTAFSLPAGGSWFWWAAQVASNGRLIGDAQSGVNPGSAAILPAMGANHWVGFARRIG